jgi:outer membrane receptor protein involved in Fe transport
VLAAVLLFLAAQSVSDTIVVTATQTRSRLGDTPASVAVLTREAITTSAAPTVDDALRQVAGFTLFRRTGSRSANPTSQGVSLRGIGASGASRALVLDDGVPLNDPFGGWIYWGRVPRAALDRVEIVRGGASDLYGSGAAGGVIQFVRRDPSCGAAARGGVRAGEGVGPTQCDELFFDGNGGSQRTGTASLFAAFAREGWLASIASDLLTTAGSVPVQASQRGAVDTPADSRHTALDLTARRLFASGSEAFARLERYGEARHNGTPLQTNRTAVRQLAGGADLHLGASSLLVRAYGSDQDYHQTFSAITADRRSERLTVDQHVPSRALGGSAQWFASSAATHVLIAGAEGREVSGASEETQFSVNGARTNSRVFGRQRNLAAYVEDVARLGPRLSVTAALRFDAWRNFDADRDGVPLASRSDQAFSPRLSALFRAGDRLALTASAYRAFRAPALNELYRSFRVGNVLTLANDSLGAERLTGFEIGARSGPLRVTLFDMTMADTVANVTLTTTPALITRRRQNLGSSRSRGAEIDLDRRIAPRWLLTAGWLTSDASLSGGKRTPQVPRNQATLQLAYGAPRASAGVQARWSSMQFDDDLNQFPLRGAFTADLFASAQLLPHLDVTLAVENVANRRVETGATPVVTVGPPRAVRAGLRVRR